MPKNVWEQTRLFDIEEYPTEEQTAILELEAWWMNHAAQEAAKTIPKALEYGSVDLELMGDAMLVLMPQLKGVVPKQELAIAFYLLGKLSRMFGAYEKGNSPSDDSWEDMGIYSKMGQHVREKGYWGK